jgi:hypothetical protein
MIKKIVLATVFSLLLFISNSQIREIPKEVREAFANQYPHAENIDFKDQLVKINVKFTQDGEKYIATYNNKGIWKGTEKEWEFEKLDDSIKDGFQKSRYADWNIDETAIIYQPGGTNEYRIKVSKSDLQKKYLYFNTKGRLKRESITI